METDPQKEKRPLDWGLFVFLAIWVVAYWVLVLLVISRTVGLC